LGVRPYHKLHQAEISCCVAEIRTHYSRCRLPQSRRHHPTQVPSPRIQTSSPRRRGSSARGKPQTFKRLNSRLRRNHVNGHAASGTDQNESSAAWPFPHPPLAVASGPPSPASGRGSVGITPRVIHVNGHAASGTDQNESSAAWPFPHPPLAVASGPPSPASGRGSVGITPRVIHVK